MTKKILSRGASVVISGVTAFLGFAGTASAQTSTILTTGPYSRNSIRNENQINCKIYISNNVSANTANVQTAHSGNVNSNNNTNAGGNWGNMDPAAWRAAGHSYAEWQAAFTEYMAAHQGQWASDWSGQRGSGGSGAQSGNANNNADTDVNVDIRNNGHPVACDITHASAGGGQGGGSISNTGPGSSNTILGSSASDTRLTNRNNVSATTVNNQSAQSGEVRSSHNTFAGNASSGNAGNQADTDVNTQISNSSGGGGSSSSGGGAASSGAQGNGSGSISNTGPGSRNTIVNSHENSFSSTNTNNVISTSTINRQYATSGDVTSNYNTHAGNARSGNAYNSADTESNVYLTN